MGRRTGERVRSEGVNARVKNFPRFPPTGNLCSIVASCVVNSCAAWPCPSGGLT
jgi:hypothetical protein